MSNVIIITGMHRSGTSLVSNLLQKAGVNVGEQLLAPNIANPRGYFEDVDFYEFHEQLLHQRGQSYLHIDEDFVFEPTPAEVEQARQLIMQRSDQVVWGWKDPRTALFLEFWQQLLPEARFLFIYRHPLEVLFSLLRRGDFDNHLILTAGLQTWYIYNAKIERFYHTYSQKSLLANIYGIVAQPEQFTDLLQKRLQLTLMFEAKNFEEIYHASDLKAVSFSAETKDILKRLYPDLFELYDQFEAKADIPAPPSILTSSSPPLHPLAKCVLTSAQPDTLAHKHGLLLLLLGSIAPQQIDDLLIRYYRQARGLEQKADQLWLQFQQLERLYSEQRMRLQQQHDLLEQQAAYIHQLSDDLNQIHQTRAWKLIQTYWSFKERFLKKSQGEMSK